MRFVGVGGCSGRQFCAGLDGKVGWTDSVVATNLVSSLVATAIAGLIDISIGLPDQGVAERVCDRETLHQPGHVRSASVFPVPARESLVRHIDSVHCRAKQKLSLLEQPFCVIRIAGGFVQSRSPNSNST